MKRLFIAGIIMALFVSGCQSSQQQFVPESETAASEVLMEYIDSVEKEWFLSVDEKVRRIDTHSEVTGSFRKKVGEEKPVLYLGMPMAIAETVGEYWVSSNADVATVQNGVLTGWKEGLVKIRHLSALDGDVLEEREFAVTTFNDGKRAEACLEDSNKLLEQDGYGIGDPIEPELLKVRINTIQDAVMYIRNSGFQNSDMAPIVGMMDSCWAWTPSAEVILTNRMGGVADLVNVLAYLLQYDFESSGFLLVQGYYGNVFPWFYEDGYYYVLDVSRLLFNMMDDSWDGDMIPFKASNEEELREYVMGRFEPEQTIAVIMTTSGDTYKIPAVYTSYQHDSSTVFSEHSVIGFEKEVLDHSRILFSNSNFDYEIIGIPEEEIPKGIPGFYKEKEFYYIGY